MFALKILGYSKWWMFHLFNIILNRHLYRRVYHLSTYGHAWIHVCDAFFTSQNILDVRIEKLQFGVWKMYVGRVSHSGNKHIPLSLSLKIICEIYLVIFLRWWIDENWFLLSITQNKWCRHTRPIYTPDMRCSIVNGLIGFLQN